MPTTSTNWIRLDPFRPSLPRNGLYAIPADHCVEFLLQLGCGLHGPTTKSWRLTDGATGMCCLICFLTISWRSLDDLLMTSWTFNKCLSICFESRFSFVWICVEMRLRYIPKGAQRFLLCLLFLTCQVVPRLRTGSGHHPECTGRTRREKWDADNITWYHLQSHLHLHRLWKQESYRSGATNAAHLAKFLVLSLAHFRELIDWLTVFSNLLSSYVKPEMWFLSSFFYFDHRQYRSVPLVSSLWCNIS